MPDPKIVLSSGEPAGIGPDIIAALDPARFEASLIAIGDRQLLESRATALGSRVRYVDYDSEPDPGTAIEVIDCKLAQPSVAGELDAANAEYVLTMLRNACHGCLEGAFDALVTAPVHKEIINRAGFPFSGHTEFLADICKARPLMLLISDKMRVALVTTHLPLRAVADAIDQDSIIEIARILDRGLQHHFGIDRPRIKVCGLNPHAGENGVLGREEIDVIQPALKTLQSGGVAASGPYPADTLFTEANLQDADAVLAMYHDQGLPVLKHSGFHGAVNTTLGLPIVRTSVDHGTALDLAGSGEARADSLCRAIESAIDQVRCLRDREGRDA